MGRGVPFWHTRPGALHVAPTAPRSSVRSDPQATGPGGTSASFSAPWHANRSTPSDSSTSPQGRCLRPGPRPP